MNSKTTSLGKFYFYFKSDGLLIAKDQTGKQIIEIISYKTIRCINSLGKSSFYFKNNKGGYVLLFKNFVHEHAITWMQNLILLIDKDVEAKEEIKIVDISDRFNKLSLFAETTRFAFSFAKIREKIVEERNANSQMRRTSIASSERKTAFST